MKIISLIPSATEIISFLGLEENLVGVSHECDNSVNVRALPKVTKSNIKKDTDSFTVNKDIIKILNLGLSVYEVNTKLLKSLDPDVIITQSQCSVCAVSIEDVEKSLGAFLNKKPMLIDLHPNTFEDVMFDICKIGNYFKKNDIAFKFREIYTTKILNIKKKLNKQSKKSILCIEWLDPFMIAGNWIPDLLKICNARAVGSRTSEKSRFTKPLDMYFTEIDAIIFMPCGYDIKTTKKELELKNYDYLKKLKNIRKFIVDGNKYFNRPGPSLVESLDILCEIIYPKLFRPKPNVRRWIEFK